MQTIIFDSLRIILSQKERLLWQKLFSMLLIKHTSCTLNADLQTGTDAIFQISESFTRMLNLKDEKLYVATFFAPK